MDRDSNPERYERVSNLMSCVSILAMNDDRWEKDHRDESGQIIQGSSGRAQTELVLSQIKEETSLSNKVNKPVGELMPVNNGGEQKTKTEEDPIEQIVRLEKDLEAIRYELARLSIDSRRLIRKKKAKVLEREFAVQQEKYYEKVVDLGAKKLARRLSIAPELPKSHFVEFASEEVINEHRRFSEAEREILDTDSGRRAQFARWYVKNSMIIFSGGLTIGVGLGNGIKKAASGAAALAAGAVIPAAIGIGLVARTTKAALMSTVGTRANQIKTHQKLADNDHEHLKGSLEQLTTLDIGQIAVGASTKLQQVLLKRIEQDQSANRKRVVKAAIYAGAAGMVGAYLGEHLPTIISHVFDHKSVGYHINRSSGIGRSVSRSPLAHPKIAPLHHTP